MTKYEHAPSNACRALQLAFIIAANLVLHASTSVMLTTVDFYKFAKCPAHMGRRDSPLFPNSSALIPWINAVEQKVKNWLLPAARSRAHHTVNRVNSKYGMYWGERFVRQMGAKVAVKQ